MAFVETVSQLFTRSWAIGRTFSPRSKSVAVSKAPSRWSIDHIAETEPTSASMSMLTPSSASASCSSSKHRPAVRLPVLLASHPVLIHANVIS